MRQLVCTVVLAVLLAVSGSARAEYSTEVKPQLEEGNAWNPWMGSYRFVFHRLSDFDLDAEGSGSPISAFAEQRLRISPAFTWKGLHLEASVDVFNGQIFGDHEALAADYLRYDRRDEDYGLDISRFLVRKAFVQWRSPIGLLRVGQQASEYGLGMLSNSGEDDEKRFGVRRYGDIVDRVLFATTPFLPLTGKGRWGEHLTLFAAGDLVFRDENADLLEDDRAWMANGGILFNHPDFTNGAIFTWRTPQDRDGDDLTAYVVNVNGKNRFKLTEETDDKKGMAVRFDYELAALWGHTTRYQQLGTEDGLDLRAFGGIGRAAFEKPEWGFDLVFELGYASGDSNPYDETSTAFNFDPDYKVGLIFFDEMLPLISARAVEILADPGHTAEPAKGIDLVASQGRVTNSLYYFPQVRYFPDFGIPLLKGMGAMLGALVLTTPAYYSHPYYTFAHGGDATNHFNVVTDSRYLGTELLAGLQLPFNPWGDHIRITLRGEGACFLPGAALEDASGNLPDPVWKAMGTAALEWK
ncbi:MAG: hypothetical protein FJ109_08775 [Deltaproteobacteria bacterium]|nr:hypothetical protein [Deltaproteobacteria bacterium]